MKNEKVIIIGSAYPLRGGGISTFNERLARAYIDNGYDVVIYTFSLQYPSFLFPGSTQYSNEPAPKDLNIKVTINSINPISWYKTAKAIRKENAKLAIVRFWLPFMAPCLGKISRLIRKDKNLKVIAITDNIIPHEARIGDKQLVKFFVNSVDCFVTMSKLVLKDLGNFDKTKPRAYYPHPLYDNFGDKIDREIALDNLELNKDFKYILFFGFIRDYKGLDLLLKAIDKDYFEKSGIKLIIAGEFYSNKDFYINLISELDISKYIVLHTQFIPNTKVANFFCASDIVVQPYKSATQSGVTQIAYHFDIPMIVTNVGGLSEMIPNNVVGYVVQPEPESIKNAIIEFYENNKVNEFRNNILTEKKRFSWDGLINTISDIVSM
jgi:glycosyltransferase involved in cell wall biosynthesis